MPVVSSALIIIACVWALHVRLAAADSNNVRLCARVLLALELVGALGVVASTVTCLVTVGGDENAKSAFFAFMLVGGIFGLFIIIIALAAALARHKLTYVRLLVTFLGALAEVAVIAPLFCILFELFGVDISHLVNALAVSIAAVITLPAMIDTVRYAKYLAEPEGEQERQKVLRARSRRREMKKKR